MKSRTKLPRHEIDQTLSITVMSLILCFFCLIEKQKTNHANNVFLFFLFIWHQTNSSNSCQCKSKSIKFTWVTLTPDVCNTLARPTTHSKDGNIRWLKTVVVVVVLYAVWSSSTQSEVLKIAQFLVFEYFWTSRHSLETFLMKKWSIMNVTPEIANLKRTTHRYIWWVMESCLIMFAFEFHCYFCCWKFFGRHLRSKHKHLNRNFYLCNIIFFCYNFISMDFLVLPSFFGDFDQIFNQNTQ